MLIVTKTQDWIRFVTDRGIWYLPYEYFNLGAFEIPLEELYLCFKEQTNHK